MISVQVEINYRDHEGYFLEKKWSGRSLNAFVQDLNLNLYEDLGARDKFGRFVLTNLQEIFKKACKSNPQNFSLETADGYVLEFLIDGSPFGVRSIKKI